jgi:GGDEF domain-containing protein
MVAFWTLAFLFFLWAIPWLPAGMSVEDYTGPVIFTFSLLGGCILLGGVAITLRSLAWRRRQALVAWTTVYEETTGLRNRRYFLERVGMECERSVQTHAFALVLFDLTLTPEQGGEPEAEALTHLMRAAGDVLAKHTRLSDIVAVISRTELAVLTPGVSPEAASRAAQRLGLILGLGMENTLGKAGYRLGLRVGVAGFGPDAADAGSLLRAARTRLTPISLEGDPQAGETAQADAA